MNFQARDAGDYTKQVGMTLASIAYAEPQNIPAQLSYPYYAGDGAYRLRWLGVTAGNQVYVCQQPGVDQWVVAIRGSATDPFTEQFWIDWFVEDLTVLYQVPFPFGQNDNNGAMISWGTEQGLLDIAGMTDARTGTSLIEFLQQNASFAPGSIVVTGHSLGGALASAVAAYIYETIGRPNGHSSSAILPLTFAAPTAGDAAFANYVSGLFDGYPFRFENSLDIAPRGWTLTGLDWVLNSYQPAPLISDFFYGLVDSVWWVLYEGNYNYTQPGAGVVDQGTLVPEFWWFREAGYQHSGETYLSMYGAPKVIFPVPPKGSPVPRRKHRPAHPM